MEDLASSASWRSDRSPAAAEEQRGALRRDADARRLTRGCDGSASSARRSDGAVEGRLSRLSSKTAACASDGESAPNPLRVNRAIRYGEALRPRLPVAAHPVLEGAKLLDPDRPARMHAPGGDPDLGAESELAAIGELGRGVVDDDRRNRPPSGSAQPQPCPRSRCSPCDASHRSRCGGSPRRGCRRRRQQ